MNEQTSIAFLTVEPGSAEPVYEQIARQIRERIAAGRLPEGTTLPSVRTLASDLGYNLNTVARAYRLLQEEGFVRIRHRWGAVVAAPPVAPDPEARGRLLSELRGVLARMRQAGVGPESLGRIVDRELAALRGGRQKKG